MITARQSRAARALLGWTQETLADKARISLTALKRLERAGKIDGDWRQTENARRARYYTLTRAGRRQLEAETADWTRRASAITRLLKADS